MYIISVYISFLKVLSLTGGDFFVYIVVMATTVKDIIIAAYAESQTLAKGSTPDGTDLKEGCAMLNELVAMYNLQEYLPFTRTVTDFAPGGARCFALSPEDGFSVPSGDKAWKYGTPAVAKSDVPVAVESLLYKNGINWIPIKKTGFADLNKYTIDGLSNIPCLFAFERNSDYGVIYLDRGTQRTLRVIFNAKLPPYGINDSVEAPDEFNQLFKYGLSKAICQKAMFPDDQIAVRANKETEILNLIKSRNCQDHEITWDDSGPSDYWNILSPHQWNRMG